ncbi:helix-turn-helix domain-containing protein [Streptomyces sp. NPDC048254]|uniref:helix-turn-helix domain-containing protein n=1 Tax=Streptomyces sp. NPDC048254 TaxID=3365525 RepID=UPI003719C260
MSTLDDNHTGARIKEQRRLARLTQRQLADRLPFSYALLNSVECGLRPATADFVAACAKALNIDVTVLTGQRVPAALSAFRLRPDRSRIRSHAYGPEGRMRHVRSDLPDRVPTGC